MGPWRRRCDRSCPANALVDVPSSRMARAGGPSGRTAYGYPSSLAGSSLRSPCSFSPRVFRRRPRDYARPAARAAQTSARATRPFRLLQAWRVASSPCPRSAHDTHVPARKRMRPAHVELELLDLSKDRGAGTLHGRLRRTLQRDEREHHRVWLRPDSCSDLTMLPYLPSQQPSAYFYNERRPNWISCLLALLALRTYNEIDR